MAKLHKIRIFLWAYLPPPLTFSLSLSLSLSLSFFLYILFLIFSLSLSLSPPEGEIRSYTFYFHEILIDFVFTIINYIRWKPRNITL